MNAIRANIDAQRWNEKYAQLQAFAREHGHVVLPRDRPEYHPLVKWLATQRKRLRHDTLAPDRHEKLARLNFEYNFHDQAWDARWAALAEFHAHHGHVQVPRDTPAGIRLADWLVDQNARFEANTLRSDRLQRLLQLGWTPAPRRPRKVAIHPQPWDHARMLAELAEFKHRFGHCRVPDDFPENRRLGQWLAYLRYRGRRQALAPELGDALLRLGVSFGPTWPERWEHYVAALQDYISRFGHARVPSHWEENPALGTWLASTRKEARRGKLAPERRERLLALGVSFEPDPIRRLNPEREDLWDQCFQRLEQFKIRHGHCHVPYDWPEDPRLASWCACQLRIWRRGAMRADRHERLQHLGLELVNRRQAPAKLKRAQQWDEQYAALVRFQQDTGHCRVNLGNAPYPSLASWVSTQRKNFHRGALDADRIQRLDAIGFLWAAKPPTARSLEVCEATLRSGGPGRVQPIEATTDRAATRKP